MAAAPWVAGYYADLQIIYEKAGKAEDAKRNWWFNLMAQMAPRETPIVIRGLPHEEWGDEKMAACRYGAAISDYSQEWLSFAVG